MDYLNYTNNKGEYGSKLFFYSFIGQLKNQLPVQIWMHMKHCCTPKTQDNCLPWFLGRPLYWGIIYTGKHNISIYAGKQYFHSEKYQRPCFRATPQSPQTAHEGGESPTPFSQLVASRLEVPFSGNVALPYSDPSWSTALLNTFFTFLVICPL